MRSISFTLWGMGFRKLLKKASSSFTLCVNPQTMCGLTHKMKVEPRKVKVGTP